MPGGHHVLWRDVACFLGYLPDYDPHYVGVAAGVFVDAIDHLIGYQATDVQRSGRPLHHLLGFLALHTSHLDWVIGFECPFPAGDQYLVWQMRMSVQELV